MAHKVFWAVVRGDCTTDAFLVRDGVREVRDAFPGPGVALIRVPATYILMAYIVMAYTVMAYIVIVQVWPIQLSFEFQRPIYSWPI